MINVQGIVVTKLTAATPYALGDFLNLNNEEVWIHGIQMVNVGGPGYTGGGGMISDATPIYVIYVCSHDTEDVTINGMKYLGDYYKTGLAGQTTKPVHPANTSEAAAEFSNGDVQLFRKMMQGYRDQYGAA